MLYLSIAVLMVLLNGFFVAAEFALVKTRRSRLEELVEQGRPFAATASWLGQRLDASLSACQLGITMASLGLGWVGEPAFARLLEPAFHAAGVTSPTVLHTSAFVVAFTLITTLHLVIGEQAPKIYAIRRPETMALWCAVPLRFFYVAFYPFLIALSWATSRLLRLVGIEGASDHDTPHSEAEIRALVREAHGHGELTRSESRLIQSVFEFDDMICRRVMIPRRDAVFLDRRQPFAQCIELMRRTQHTRYPLCDGSLEDVLGIVHIKDLVGLDGDDDVDLVRRARPAHHVPETMPISRLMRHFQRSHQHMAVVVDEYGSVSGLVTLENVLEQIVGPVEDEFDREMPYVTAEDELRFVVPGNVPLNVVNQRFDLDLRSRDVDTLAGVMVERLGKVLAVGDRVDFGGPVAEVLEVDGAHVERIRVTLPEPGPSGE